MDDVNPPRFSFLKGAEDVFGKTPAEEFDWQPCAAKARELLGDAMNARHLSFLLGSGCSSFSSDGEEHGIPTMAPLAEEFLQYESDVESPYYPSSDEAEAVKAMLGIDIEATEFRKNLERLMEVLYSARFVAQRSNQLKPSLEAVDSVIKKTTLFLRAKCDGETTYADSSPVLSLYQAFYRRLVFRERNLPPPWVFTTNYDLFSETALDRLGTPYCNGFSGTVERRFNPATYRYSLAEQLDISSRKWSSVDGYLYLCKLHGSVNWVEDHRGLFPIREALGREAGDERVMIYPTPTKQNASFGAPYSDLFREFQSQVAREQSVLVVLGYGFGDEHINNLIFQALTVPSFRLIVFVSPQAQGIVAKLRDLQDPRIWLIGGDGANPGTRAHYFNTFVESFMPEPPGSRVEGAVEKVLAELLERKSLAGRSGGPDEER